MACAETKSAMLRGAKMKDFAFKIALQSNEEGTYGTKAVSCVGQAAS